MSIEAVQVLDTFRFGDFSPEALAAANDHFEGARPDEIVTAVADLEPWALSSFGFNAAALFETVKRAKQDVPVVYIDTGFEHPETREYVDTLSRYYGGLRVTTVSADAERVREAAAGNYYDSDPDAFNDITKHEPLGRFFAGFPPHARILLGGLRRAQGKDGGAVAIRRHTKIFKRGPHGELRVNPNVDMTDEEVDALFEGGVPVHPLRPFYDGDRLPPTCAPQGKPKRDCTINWDEFDRAQAS